MTPQNFDPLQPKIVLAIGAHADDIDFAASGSLAKWARDGAEIHYLVITDGRKGTSDPTITPASLVAARQQEQRDAAQVVGTQNVHFLDYEDGTLENTTELKQELVRIIREIKPDTVVALDPTVLYIAELGFINHPDHRAAGQATLDAVYPLARDHLSFPDLYSAGLEPHKVSHLLLINFDHTRQNYYIDIGDTYDTKLTALQKHTSQVSQSMIDAMNAQAKQTGAAMNKEYGEGFVRIDIPA